MDDLTKDQNQDKTSDKPEIGNKRKRRYSSTESDESLKKRITTTTTSAILTGTDEEENKIKYDTKTDVIEKDVSSNTSDINEESYQHGFLIEELCDEVLYEIVKLLDTWSLMALRNVSKRFQTFVLDKRLWEHIDLSQEPLPLGILEDMLERSYDKTKTIKLRGPSPSQHIEGEIQHFNQTIHKSLTTRCTKLVTLELYGITLDFNQTKIKDFPQTLKRLVFNNCNIRVNSNKSLFTGIDTVLVNLEELVIENNLWFDPYYIMTLSKLPELRYLSLKGCWQMQELIPYGSIAARHGFKKLEILDLRDTPLNDSDLQCFNAVETLKEIYLQCPAEDSTAQMPSCSTATGQSETTKNNNNSMLNCTINSESDNKPSTSANCAKDSNKSSENIIVAPLPARNPSVSESESNTSAINQIPSTLSLQDRSSIKDNETKTGEESTSPIDLSEDDSSSSFSSSSSSSFSSSSSSPLTSCTQLQNTIGANNENVTEGSPTASSSHIGLSSNIVPLVGTNTPQRSHFLPRPDHIFYLDVRNRTVPNAIQFNVSEPNNVRQIRLHNRGQQNQQNQPNQPSPPPLIEQMMRQSLFWDIVNPLGRVVGEENGAEYHLNLFPLSNTIRQQTRGTISDRGVCCFGRTRQPVQRGIIWLRFNNRPTDNRFERFSVRDYKSVTDVSLQHLVQCSPHLVFLDVSGTSVTLEGLQRFKELKPECKVIAEHLVGITTNV